MYKTDVFISAEDIKEIVGISKSKAYSLIQELNAELAGPMGQNESDEMKFWTKEEYMKFIPTMANKPYSYMAFELLYWCGIRLGELRALTPADFNFETNMLCLLVRIFILN